jgi:hypothetical protein
LKWVFYYVTAMAISNEHMFQDYLSDAGPHSDDEWHVSAEEESEADGSDWLDLPDDALKVWEDESQEEHEDDSNMDESDMDLDDEDIHEDSEEQEEDHYELSHAYPRQREMLQKSTRGIIAVLKRHLWD